MSDGSIIIDVILNKDEFDKGIAALGDSVKVATAALAGAAIAAGAVAAAVYKVATIAADAGERIFELSKRTGLSTTALQEWDYILSQTGGSVESLGMGMKQLTDKMFAARDGNEEASASFAALGISVTDLKTKTREQIFEAVIKGLQGMTDEGKRAAIGADILGRSYLDLAPALATSSGETEKLRQKAHDLNLVMGAESAAAGDQFNDAMETMSRVFQQIVIIIGQEFIPAMTRIMEAIAAFVGNKERMESMVTVFKLTSAAVLALAAGLAAYGTTILVMNAGLIAATVAQWGLNVAMSANPIALTIGLIAALIVALVALSGNIGAVVVAIGQFFGDLLTVANFVFQGIIDWLIVSIPAALTASASYFSNFGANCATVFAALKNRLDGGVRDMKSWADGFKASVKTVSDYLATIPDQIGNIMTVSWNRFVDGCSKLIAVAREQIAKFVIAIVDGVKDIPNILYKVGENMVLSLWNGLKAWFDALIAWAKAKFAELAAVLAGGTVTTDVNVNSVSSIPAPSPSQQSGGNVYNYNQTINSPEPLSPAEIRRAAEDSMALWGVT